MKINFEKPILSILVFCTFHTGVFAQDTININAEHRLDEVIIRAFEQNRKLREVPAAVNYINRQSLERFSPASIVHAVNTLPGVRMEERSPGSYRFSIRGSSLRSPFGVRNVKVYFNEIPFTDPGGHTYLNQLGYYNFNSIEIIKGPGSSLYGAGTGGVLMIESLNESEKAGAFVEYGTGSYNLQNIYGSVTTKSGNLVSRAGFQHQQSNGFRNHSELKRQVHSWTGLFRFNENRFLKTSFLYGDLFYETPGALTRSEYMANPRAARPGGFGFPGAEAAKASIRQRTFMAGASYEQRLHKKWINKSVLYGMFTELRNPTIRNYGKSSEPHVGGRTVFKFTQPFNSSLFRFDIGGEWQEGFGAVNIHKNVNGLPDSLQVHDEISNRQSFIFGQASLDFNNWSIVAGGSWNWLRIRFQRFVPVTFGEQTRNFSNELAPRLALMRKFGKFNIYSSVSKGFSPPTTAELLPTGGAINLDLNAEEGINYDLGMKGTIVGRLYMDINAFLFSLDNTIVQRRDSAGGDFFVNAGKTDQKGIETYITHPVFTTGIFERSLFWFSHTWHDFKYREFKQVNSDYSGNSLPGTAPNTISAGFDVQARNGLLGSITYYFSERFPLNDANSEYADAYHLLGLRIGFQKWFANKWRVKLIAGVENMLDQTYSLGNDLNGFGGRFFNAANGRNYYVSLLMELRRKER